MGPQTIGILATTGLLLAAAGSAAAQSRPDVSFSESARSTGPTCVVGGTASDCAGSAVPFPIAPGSGVAVAPVVVGPFLGGVFGGPAGGESSTSVDVDRSTRQGATFAR